MRSVGTGSPSNGGLGDGNDVTDSLHYTYHSTCENVGWVAENGGLGGGNDVNTAHVGMDFRLLPNQSSIAHLGKRIYRYNLKI